MENNKIDKVIEAFRRYRQLKEEAITNSVGTGGYTSAGDPKSKGGFDPVMPGDMRRRKRIKLGPNSRKMWKG